MLSISLFCYFRKNQLICLDSSQDFPGIVDVKWECPKILWTCENDGLCKWDLRVNPVNKCAQRSKYNDVVCFDYNYYNTILTGHMSGDIMIWDTRKNTHVKTLQHNKHRIYDKISSLTFDANHLYVVTKCNYIAFDYRYEKPEINTRRYSSEFISTYIEPRKAIMQYSDDLLLYFRFFIADGFIY